MKLHKEMSSQEISSVLRTIAAAYEITGESIFRVRAYENAADSVEHASRELKDLWEDGKLQELPGVGSNIESHIDELFKTGKVNHFNQVLKRIFPSVIEFIEIPGIGPKNANKLAKNLGIKEEKKAIEKLKIAALKGKIRNIEGFGINSEQAIIKGIEEYLRRENRLLLIDANKIVKIIIDYMKKHKSELQIDPLGSLKRRCSTVEDLDLGVATRNPVDVIKHFTQFSQVKQILASGENTARVILNSGVQVDLKTQTPDKYGALLQHFTGSKAHNIHLREIALKKGMSLSEHGIKVKGNLKSYADEKSFYQALGMEWIPPELRENQGEIEASLKNELPHLITSSDLRGDLHLHTNYQWRSSHDAGINSMQEMVEKAEALGYEYIALGDHNPSISSGSEQELIKLTQERNKHIEYIKNSLQAGKNRRSIKILNTLEIDILTGGKLSLPEKALNLLDFAIVSIHSSMRMSKEKMTKRILKGLSHPKAKILGHPTGRLLNKREGYEVDWEKVLKFLKSTNKYLEINAWPKRLDFPDTLVRQAIKYGIKLVINTDAHSVEHLNLMKYGVDVARRGWAQKQDILNTKPFNQLKKSLLT